MGNPTTEESTVTPAPRTARRRSPSRSAAGRNAPLAAKGDKYARRWLHATPDDLSAAAYVTLEPYYYYSTTTNATHGSPHDYDTRVSLIFYGAPFKPGKYGGFVRTVDIAPTLAAALGIAPTEPLDGVVLRAALR